MTLVGNTSVFMTEQPSRPLAICTYADGRGSSARTSAPTSISHHDHQHRHHHHHHHHHHPHHHHRLLRAPLHPTPPHTPRPSSPARASGCARRRAARARRGCLLLLCLRPCSGEALRSAAASRRAPCTVLGGGTAAARKRTRRQRLREWVRTRHKRTHAHTHPQTAWSTHWARPPRWRGAGCCADAAARARCRLLSASGACVPADPGSGEL